MKAEDEPILVLGVEQLEPILALQALCPEVHAWSAANWQCMLTEADGLGPVRRQILGVLTPSRDLAGVVAGSSLDDCGELEMLLVHPGWRRCGIGRVLAERWLAWAQMYGVLEVTLEVRCSNSTAQRLYRALGFAEIARRADYYQAPVEDALVLLKQMEPTLGIAGSPLDTTV